MTACVHTQYTHHTTHARAKTVGISDTGFDLQVANKLENMKGKPAIGDSVYTHTKAKAVGLSSLRLGFDQVSKRIQHQVLYSLVRKTPWWKDEGL